MRWFWQNGEVLRTLPVIIGGAFGLYLAWLRVTAANRQAEAQIDQARSSAKQAELGQQKLIADLIGQAVGQLRDEKLEIRLLAVYTLRRIAVDHANYKQDVIEVLGAYVRDNAARDLDGELPLDIQEILQILGIVQERKS